MTAVFPLATEPTATSFPPSPVSTAFFQITDRPDDPAQYLVEITAFKGGETRSGGLATLAEIPTATIPTGGGVNTGQVTLLYADRHYVGSPTDPDKPNEYYEGRVEVPLVMERSMSVDPTQPVRVQRQFGFIQIANGDGQLDSVVQSFAVDGRQVRVLFGPFGNPYSDFECVADMLGKSWETDDETVRLALRDQTYSLDKPLQDTLYAGTGGAEGSSEVEGKPKPLLFGKALNVTPILIDATNLIYQVHDGAINAVLDVYDQGAALTDSLTDVSGYSNLVSQAVSAGEFATALDVGMFKVGSSPAGLVTCDVEGDATPSYANTLDVIALRLLEDRAGLSASLIREDTFAGAGALAGELGFYIGINEEPSTGEVLDLIMASIGGWWGAARDGRIRAGRLSNPAGRSPNIYLDELNVLKLEQETSIVPTWRYRVGYARNWTVQRGEDLAASVTDARRQFLTEPFQVVSASDAVVKTRHLEALDPPPIPTLYAQEADAQTLATHLKDLHSPDRRVFRATVKRLGYRIDLQSIARLTWSRFGLDGGKKFTVVGIREDADKDETILRLWG